MLANDLIQSLQKATTYRLVLIFAVHAARLQIRLWRAQADDRTHLLDHLLPDEPRTHLVQNLLLDLLADLVNHLIDNLPSDLEGVQLFDGCQPLLYLHYDGSASLSFLISMLSRCRS